MFLDCLGDQTRKELYLALTVQYGDFPANESEIKTHFHRYCVQRGLPVSEESMFKLLDSKGIYLGEKTYCPIVFSIEGTYVPEYDGLRKDQAFGLEALKQNLDQFRNRNITIIVLEKVNG